MPGGRGEVGPVNRKEVTYGSRELSNVLRSEVSYERMSGGHAVGGVSHTEMQGWV